MPERHAGWALGGLTYAGYNVVGAVIILPVLRHLRSDKDALLAGALAGPLAMIPALLFFICMVAYYPQIGGESLPSDFLLKQLNFPAFHFLFQLMIYLALLESGTGCVHAFNERIAEVYAARQARTLSKSGRLDHYFGAAARIDISGNPLRSGNADRTRLSRIGVYLSGYICGARLDCGRMAAIQEVIFREVDRIILQGYLLRVDARDGPLIFRPRPRLWLQSVERREPSMFKLPEFGKSARPHAPTKPVVKTKPLKSPWHAVSIAKGRRPCAAVARFNGQRWLPKNAPKLPVEGCTLTACDCRYRHHDDRRAKARRESDTGAGSRGVKEGDRRVSQSDRRKPNQ